MTQHDFLKGMGMHLRLLMLLKKSNAKEREALVKSFERLTRPDAMGNIYKFLAITSQNNAPFPFS